jgi:APA family basic amino acid/polyamine antiporter
MQTKTEAPALERALGLWSATSIIIGTVIGGGIFLVPTDMIKAVGTPSMVFLVWIFGGLLSLFGALTYGELSAALPDAGGEYVYLNAAYGPFFGFIYGWTQTWVAKSASLATLATSFYTYSADFFPILAKPFLIIPLPIGPGGGPLPIRYGQLAGILIILFLAGVNYAGVRAGGGVQVAMTSLKLGLILALVLGALFSSASQSANLHTSTPAELGGTAGFFAALVAALWAYDGWNNAGMLGSEIDKPERNLPRALVLGTLLTVALYMLTNWAYFSVLSAPEVAGSERVAADMMRKILGAGGGRLVSAAAMVSIFAAINGSILSGSRVPYAMARNGYFFSFLAKVHPRFRTPSTSIVVVSCWACVLMLSGQYKQLYTMVIFPSWILYGMTAASVIVLRVRRPDLPRPYKVAGYPLVPVLFVLVAGALLWDTFRSSPRESGIGLILILLGLPFYRYWSAKISRVESGRNRAPQERT